MFVFRRSGDRGRHPRHGEAEKPHHGEVRADHLLGLAHPAPCQLHAGSLAPSVARCQNTGTPKLGGLPLGCPQDMNLKTGGSRKIRHTHTHTRITSADLLKNGGGGGLLPLGGFGGLLKLPELHMKAFQDGFEANSDTRPPATLASCPHFGTTPQKPKVQFPLRRYAKGMIQPT